MADASSTAADRRAVIDALYEARRDGKVLTQAMGGDLTFDEALAVQLAVLGRFLDDGEVLAGYKSALSSGRMRDRMGVGFRPFGFVTRNRLIKSGSSIPLASIANCRIEPELCVVLRAPLRGPGVTVEEARAAVVGVAAAFEINELRLGPARTDAMLVADGLANWGIVVGPVVPVPGPLPETRMRFYRDEVLINDVTPGDDLDDPFLSLTRTTATFDRFGMGFEPGQHVMTGSFCASAVDQPATYRADFAGIGEVSITFR